VVDRTIRSADGMAQLVELAESLQAAVIDLQSARASVRRAFLCPRLPATSANPREKCRPIQQRSSPKETPWKFTTF